MLAVVGTGRPRKALGLAAGCALSALLLAACGGSPHSPRANPSPTPAAHASASPGAGRPTPTPTPKANPQKLPSLSDQTAAQYIRTQVSGRFSVGTVSKSVLNGISTYSVTFHGNFEIPSRDHACLGIPKGEHVRTDEYRAGVAEFQMEHGRLTGVDLEGTGHWKESPAVTCK